MNAKCAGGLEHEWRWLDQPVHYLTVFGSLRRAVNVECVRCGGRTWRHGNAPNRPTLVVRPSAPATDRST